MNAEDLAIKLEKYPHLKDRIESMLSIVENTTGEFETADEAEMAVIKEVRKMGNDMLSNWANTQEDKKYLQALKEKENLLRHSKKNFIGKQLLDK